MDKDVLIQYSDMKVRIKILREKIKKLENEIEKLKNSIAGDTVRGGYGGTQHYKIEGVPYGLIGGKQELLEKRMMKLEEEELELLRLTNEAEEYIQTIYPIELRNMFDLYYLQDLNWSKVAYRMNVLYPNRKIPYTDENCRKRNQRFFEKNN